MRRGPIAAGSFGHIYEGIYQDNPVAIKVLKPYQHSNVKNYQKVVLFRHRLYHILTCNQFIARESILWAQLSHPNVLPFIGVCELGGEIGLVSPWMKNGDVMEYLEKNPHADRGRLVRCIILRGIVLRLNIVRYSRLGTSLLGLPISTARVMCTPT